MVNTLHKTTINKLESIVDELRTQAKDVDNSEQFAPTTRYSKQTSLFAQTLFHQNGTKYSPFVEEVAANIKQIKLLLSKRQDTIAYSLLERIEHQVSALISAFNALGSMKK